MKKLMVVCPHCKDKYGAEESNVRVQGNHGIYDFFCDECDWHIENTDSIWEESN